ncbi:hypothetical protein COW82_01090 [Candidatus Campbellbacteria bacterium CG22_combo_CG10-13_8_21_14_all_43_18]|uniref:Uncharacterized protein n=1 Tax=Candidatus Campbellbacteria bacterium CG22_combo_CG10-13_8_21_14_all_43_18 TaxID=1974530 RepID=A0A2H0DY12_9BACT|nr:MAG: hypothetical protein COW82_01090 [Candidatus Campbellbacteria bacterium CG22_combo_CG10-13_8_21_14_all_43_18]
MIKSQAGDIPEGELDKILDIVEKNPELFQKIAAEIQAEISSGKDQMTASMEIMKKYEEELKQIKN